VCVWVGGWVGIERCMYGVVLTGWWMCGTGVLGSSLLATRLAGWLSDGLSKRSIKKVH
jgi:hypothetical protein